MEYVPAKRTSLKASPSHNEAWLQKVIEDDVTVLGLGELTVHDRQRPQPRAGRLDLLLSEPESGTRYEVEIQLGATDESHIIRTIEYWDIEKSRYPQYEHVAVLVAEDITSRFLNVISHFNKAIPMIAIQLNALEVDGKLTLDATTVLDLMRRGTDEEDEPGPPVDRNYWDQRSSSTSMATMDRLEKLIQDATNDPTLSLNYTRGYVGFARNGVADNFVVLYPRKREPHVLAAFRLEVGEELTARIQDAGLDEARGYSRRGRYYIRIASSDLHDNKELLTELVRRATDISAATDD
jgi:hypothetical protein